MNQIVRTHLLQITICPFYLSSYLLSLHLKTNRYMTKTLSFFTTPQLTRLHTGKVRDSYRINPQTRLIAVSDRLSAFDFVLETPIPNKGAVLNSLASWWFQQTQHLVPNHFIQQIDPNITLVKEAEPIRVEMVVRGYLSGSVWRGYQEGERTFSGVTLPVGLVKHARFDQPIVTPTTKEKNDRPISAEELVNEGFVTTEHYLEMHQKALLLYQFGQRLLEERGIILVDTKYEFGLLNGEIILIDEIHTPDSSRFWSKEDYQANPENARQIDKEYVRQWLIANKIDGEYPTALPQEVIEEAAKRYIELYEKVTGQTFDAQSAIHPKARICANLCHHQLIKDAAVAIVTDVKQALPFCEKAKEMFKRYDIFAEVRLIRKESEINLFLEDYNDSVEPAAVLFIEENYSEVMEEISAYSNLPIITSPLDDLTLTENLYIDIQDILRCLNVYRIRESLIYGEE